MVTNALRAMQTLAATIADTPSMAATEKSKCAIDSRDGVCTGDVEREREEASIGSTALVSVSAKNSGPAAFRSVNTALHHTT